MDPVFLNTEATSDIKITENRILASIYELLGTTSSSDKIYSTRTQQEYLHSVRVAVISVCIGKILGYNRDLVNELCLAGLLHDIGKKFVPVEIILKPSKLDEIEKDIIRAHPAMSAYYLRERYKYINEDVLLGVYEHHERLDGTGYPRGLKGEEISEIGRIIAIADVLEAYSSERSYHEARSLKQTIKYLETNTGLDQYIIGQLKEHIGDIRHRE